MAPGCHVTVADPSGATTAPAEPAIAAAVRTTGTGTGAGVTGALGRTVAEVEPPRPVAVTTRPMEAPMSPGVSGYVGPAAPTIATHAAAHRCHWKTKEIGAPLHAPTEAVSVCPATAVPLNDGMAVTAGRAAAPPAFVTAVVAGETADPVPAGAVAV